MAKCRPTDSYGGPNVSPACRVCGAPYKPGAECRGSDAAAEFSDFWQDMAARDAAQADLEAEGVAVAADPKFWRIQDARSE